MRVLLSSSVLILIEKPFLADQVSALNAYEQETHVDVICVCLCLVQASFN